MCPSLHAVGVTPACYACGDAQVQARVQHLRDLQDKHDAAEEQYHKELKALQAKYTALYGARPSGFAPGFKRVPAAASPPTAVQRVHEKAMPSERGWLGALLCSSTSGHVAGSSWHKVYFGVSREGMTAPAHDCRPLSSTLAFLVACMLELLPGTRLRQPPPDAQSDTINAMTVLYSLL